MPASNSNCFTTKSIIFHIVYTPTRQQRRPNLHRRLPQVAATQGEGNHSESKEKLQKRRRRSSKRSIKKSLSSFYSSSLRWRDYFEYYERLITTSWRFRKRTECNLFRPSLGWYFLFIYFSFSEFSGNNNKKSGNDM